MKSFWKRYKKYIIIGIILVVIWLIVSPQEKKISYITEIVAKNTVDQIVSVTGSVEADPKIQMRFQKPGKIDKIFVSIGDKVNKNDILASLELTSLHLQMAQAKAGLDLAKANLNLRIIGPSNEEIDVSQTSINSAIVAYNASLTALEQAKKSASENIKKAQLQISNAEIALSNAQKQYENSIASQTTTSDTSNQSLLNAYDNAKPIINSALVSLKSALPLADSVLGIDMTAQNGILKNNLGILNLQSKIDAENAYAPAKNSLQNLEELYAITSLSWTPTNIDTILTNTLGTLQKMRSLIHNTHSALIDTIPSSDYNLETLKRTFSDQESAIVANITSVQGSMQTIKNASLGISSSDISTSSALDRAKADLDIAKNNVETSRRSMEQIVVENEKMITASQADVDLKAVAVSASKANHIVKTAKPRSVDIASLEAQVEQAKSQYELSLQAIKDAQIIAPIDGVITEINGEVGENTMGSETIIVMISPTLKIKANVSETDITKIKIDDSVRMTLDAFPADQVFQGKIIEINPAETVVQGVIYYQVTALFDITNSNIKSGMTTNLDILTNKKENVITVSPQAVQYKDNKPFVKVLQNNTAEDIFITTGLEGNKLIEVTKGLQEGMTVILYQE